MAAACDLLLTEYLLNFEDENDNECSFATEGFSSGIECSDDEDKCSLAAIKETIKASPKKAPVKQKTEKPTAEKGRLSHKLTHERTAEDKERDRLRSWEYRQRRSKKMKTTEEECRQLKETNKALNEKNIELDKKVLDLEKQIEYLENVIANESGLSSVLGAIAKNSGIPFNNNPVFPMNLQKRKRADSVNDENEPLVKKKQSNGGVCLHLKPGGMSLEFCRECDVNASAE